MKLTRSQTVQLLNHLRRHWKDPQTCPICHEEAWKVPQSILELREYEEGNIILYPKDSSMIPLVAVTCTVCGYTFLINALTTDILHDQNEGGEENE